MQAQSLCRFTRRAAALLAAAVFALFAAQPALAQGPIGNLTVTAKELPDGGTRFSLSGSTTAKNTGWFYETPMDLSGDAALPRANRNDYSTHSLPSGLFFDIGGDEFSLNYISFASGGWFLYVDSAYVETGDTISGHGSVDAPDREFSDLVPGTFIVQGYFFDITYRVVPLAPSLRTPNRVRFPRTVVGSTSRPRRISITNVGDAPAARIRTRVSGPGSSSFQVSQPASRNLAPGASTVFVARFAPGSAGAHRATVRVLSNARTETTNLIGRGRVPVATSPRSLGRF